MLVNQSPETRSAAVPAWLPEPLSRWQARAALRAARTPLLAFGAHLALALVVASLVMLLAPPRDSTTAAPPMDGLADIVIRPLANWDGVWYTGIAEHGYQYRQAQAAFWPLYPLLIRAGHTLTGLSYATVGVLVSNGAFLAALVLFHRLARLEWGRRVADRAVWLLALAPMAFFFSTAYTESLFLLLTVGAFYAARTDRWQWAGACGFLAALTRNVGGLLLLPLAIMLIQRYGWSPRRWWSRALPLAMIPVAPLFFFAHLDRVWGDPLLTIHAQRYW
ncbi:MAG: hypothetical protein IRY97_11885, partial [Thermomicrobiaceae bacterium]|nr:hypothetical protein [Thermomicrobiaceae bacterium]